MKFCVAVHAGAGYHNPDKASRYEEVCREACRTAAEGLAGGGTALEGAVNAVRILENSGITNAGCGSNLTVDGHVECDAGVMDGESLLFGAVGAVSGVLNPVNVAWRLVEDQRRGSMPLGRVPPSVLVGEGARHWAEEHDCVVVDAQSMVTEEAEKCYRDNLKKVDKIQNRLRCRKRGTIGDIFNEVSQFIASDIAPGKRRCGEFYSNISSNGDERSKDFCLDDLDGIQDTVGAVAIDRHGNVASAASSGGILLKHSGRIGLAATYGAGCWAENATSDHPAVAVVTSGCGEHLMRTLFARQCSENLRKASDTTSLLEEAFRNDFFNSRSLRDVRTKLAGCLALRYNVGDLVDITWAYSTDSMCVAYMEEGGQAESTLSRLPSGKTAGTTVCIEGVARCW